MAIYLEQYKLQYFPAPKNACTSLKTIFYLLQHGHAFEPTYAEGRLVVHIHNWRADYSTSPFGSEHSRPNESATKLAVVRDPIARILSCYTNRVQDFKELSADHIDPELGDRLGVPLNPGIDQFILNLTKYRALSANIKHHTDLQSYFLGPDLGQFDLVYKIDEMGRVASDLSRITGIEIAIPHEQKSRHTLQLADLTRRAQQELIRIAAADYAMLKGYYAPPASL